MVELGLAVGYHTALGLLLAVLVWIAGAGVLALLQRPRDARSLLDAYPFGLLVAIAAATLPLLWRPLAAVSVGVAVALVWLGLRRNLPRVRSWSRVVLALAACAGCGAGLGALLHGPSDELDSSAYGGMLFYVDKVVSAAQTIDPFRDLLAEGERIIYAEAGTSFAGAALSWLPGFDPVLYNAATLPAFALASLVGGLALFVRAGLRTEGVALAAASLLAVAILPYPTWITETPPAAFALPLVFAVWRVWRDSLDARWLAALSVVAGVDLFMTKVVGVLALGLLLVFGLVTRGRRRPDFRRLLAIGGALLALGAAAMIALLFLAASWYSGLYERKALPLDAARALADGSFEARSVGLALLVAGEVVLAAALARGRSWALLGVFVPTVLLSWFVAGYGFDIALVLEVFLVALALLAGDRIDARLALAAGVLLAVAVAVRDATGVQPGAMLALLVLLAFTAVLVPQRLLAWSVAVLCAGVALALAGAPELALAAPALVGGLIGTGVSQRLIRVACIGVAAVAVVVVAVRAGDLDVGDPAVTLTPADYDIWNVVNERVDADALIFTTLTGLEVTPHRGWNNYPSLAGRQLYIAGWYDGRLVSHPEDRDQQLALNRAVLNGRVAPGSLALSRSYNGYFVVARNAERMPASFRRLYANDTFSLYEIP